MSDQRQQAEIETLKAEVVEPHGIVRALATSIGAPGRILAALGVPKPRVLWDQREEAAPAKP